MKKQWMIAILAVVCVALVACGVLIGTRLQSDHSAPDTRSSPNGDMLTAEEMQEQIETLQKEHKALNEALELRDQERTRLQEELSDAKSALEASTQEKEALKGEAEKLTSELSDAQGKIQTLNASLEKAEIDQLKADNTLLQSRIDEIQTALDAANKEKDSLAGQVSTLQEEIDSLKGDLAKAEESAQTKSDEFDARLAALNTELTTARETAAAVLEEKNTLTQQLANVQAALTEQETQNGDYQTRSDALNSRIAALEADIVTVNAALERAESDKKALEEKVTALTKEADSLKADAQKESDGQNAQVDELQAALTELRAQNEAYQAQLAALTESLNTAGQEKEALDTQTASLQTDISTVNTALEESQANTRSMEERVAELTEQLNSAKADSQQDRDSLNQQLSELRTALAEQQTQTDAYQAEAVALKDSLNTALQENKTLTTKITTLKTSISFLKSALTTYKDETAELETSVASLTQQLDDTNAKALAEQENLNGQISGLQADLAAADQEIAALQADAEALRGDLAQSLSNAQALENQVASLNQELSSTKTAAQEEQTRLNGRITELEANLKSTEDSLTAKRQENEALTAQLTSTTATLAKTQDDLTSTKTTLANTQEDLTNTKATLANTQEDLTNTKATLANTQDALAAETQDNEEKRQRIAVLEGDLADEEDRNSKLLGQLENLVAAMQTETTFQLVDTDAEGGDELTTLLNQYVGLEALADASVRRQGILPEQAAEADESETVLTVNGEAVSRAKVESAIETALLIRKHVLEQHPDWENQPSMSMDRTVVGRQIVTQMADNLALWQKAQSLGLDVMTEAERQAIIDQAIEQQAITGYSAEELLPSLLVSQTLEKLRVWAAQDVTVTEEEFLRELSQRRTATQALYEEDPDAFCQLIESGEGYYHYPASFRRIKHIFLPADAIAYDQLKTDLKKTNNYIIDLNYRIATAATTDEAARLKDKKAAAEEMLADLQTQWDATAAQSEQVIQQAQAAAADIYARLKAGESIDTLVAEYSQDTEMPEGGYVVCDGRKLPFREFIVRSLTLPCVGSATRLIVADDGYHILYFAEDLSNDWASLRNNRADLQAEMLAQKRQQAADDAIAQWIEEADIQISPTLLSF